MARTLTLTASEIAIGAADPDTPEDGCISAASQGSPLAEGETAILYISETSLTITRIDVYNAAGEPVRSYHAATNMDNNQNFAGLGDGSSSPDALNTSGFAGFENIGQLQLFGTGPGFGEGTLLVTPGGLVGDGGTKVFKTNAVTFDPDAFPTDIPCFVAGTRIETDRGHRPVESIRPGDKVRTRDRGLQTVVFAASRTVPALGHLAPVIISQGVLGNSRTLAVSPNHRLLVRSARIETLFGVPEMLVAAKDMVDGRRIFRRPATAATYVHIAFAQHEIVFAEGAPAESLQPQGADASLIGTQACAELLEVFPELGLPQTRSQPTRAVMAPSEASLLF